MAVSFQLMCFTTRDAVANEASRLTDAAARILGPHGITLRVWPPAARPVPESILPFDQALDRWADEVELPIRHVDQQERFRPFLDRWLPVIFCRYLESQNSVATTFRDPGKRLRPFVMINTRLTAADKAKDGTMAHEIAHAGGLDDVTDMRCLDNLMFFDRAQRTGTSLVKWQVDRIATAYFHT